MVLRATQCVPQRWSRRWANLKVIVKRVLPAKARLAQRIVSFKTHRPRISSAGKPGLRHVMFVTEEKRHVYIHIESE